MSYRLSATGGERKPSWTKDRGLGETQETGPFRPSRCLAPRDDPGLHSQCATRYIKHKLPIRAPLWNGAMVRHGKIRLAYLSADFRDHAVAQVMAELLERHDRSRFEVMGISFGPDDGSEMRGRLQRAFDEFIDVRAERDGDIARLLHGREVDIAVDLMGYTLHSRPEILGFRPAPIQVNYLGYPGTLGADFIDYVIADPVVLPFDQQPFYTEQIVHLPDCYLPYDTGGRSPNGRRAAAMQACPSKDSSSARSTTVSRSWNRCFRFGCGCCIRLTEACCG